MRTTSKAAVLPLIFTALTLSSCSRNFERIEFTHSEKQPYLDRLEVFRERKNLFFRSNAASPLTRVQKENFRGLDYYPPNFSLIFKVKLLREGPDENVKIAATGGETRPATRYGKFSFKVAGKNVSLYVYKLAGDRPDELFLPFVDETCGKTSYAGGRYIDLRENKSGEYILDFNYAYNPYCAYNHDYSCPIVPSDNRLPVQVTAGEMKYR